VIDCALDAGVRRVVGIGAAPLTSQPLQEYGWRWHILGDPDGNEFRVIQPPGAHGPAGTGPV
jgi:glyoxalase superfamily protein